MTGLEPWLSPYADALLTHARSRVEVTSTYRSIGRQLSLWLTRSMNPYPVAPPGQSYHNYGRAFDLKASPDELAWLGSIWRSWGGTWNPSDAIHFQA